MGMESSCVALTGRDIAPENVNLRMPNWVQENMANGIVQYCSTLQCALYLILYAWSIIISPSVTIVFYIEKTPRCKREKSMGVK